MDAVTCHLVCDQGALLSSAALTRPPSICIPQTGICDTKKSNSIRVRALSCYLPCSGRLQIISNAPLKQS